MTDLIEVQHMGMEEGRALLRTMDFPEQGIPSIVPLLEKRWKAEFKGKFLDPGINAQVLDEVLRITQSLSDITTQRAVYYAIRGAHPDWTYKDGPLGDEFYDHLINWVMEKAQLKTGLTMQAMGIWAAPRGYIAGDGVINTRLRGRIMLSASPNLGFDLADEGVTFATHAKKIIHFEKDAGLSNIIAHDFPKYIEAIFSTSQGALTESATKFLRQGEDIGLNLYAVHDGDPSGIQMQLMYGMASKNNCYMPSEFYPTLVKPLGFYPSIGEELGLPPEAVTDKEDKIFHNLVALVNEKNREFPELRRFRLGREVNVIIKLRQKWEFQALNAIHEAAPKVYLIEALRVHNDEIKHVPDAASIQERVLANARATAAAEVENSLAKLAGSLYDTIIKPQLISTLRTTLAPQIKQYNDAVTEALEQLDAVPAQVFREEVKARLLGKPHLYSPDVVKMLGKDVLSVWFNPSAKIKASLVVTDIAADVSVQPRPPVERRYITKTMLVDAIEKLIIKSGPVRHAVVVRIREALENRFGEIDDEW